jgi:hypothetical protein
LVEYQLAPEVLGVVMDVCEELGACLVLWMFHDTPMWVQFNYITNLTNKQ